MTGGPCSLSALVPADAFEVTRGDPVVGGLKGPEVDHMFCPECMSWVFTRVMDGAFVNVRSVMFDDPSGTAPFVEVYLCEKLPWVATSAPHRFERFPEPDAYPALMAEYAAQT